MPIRDGLERGIKQYYLELLDQLLTIENVIGVKKEALDVDHNNKIVEAISDKAVIVGAGSSIRRCS